MTETPKTTQAEAKPKHDKKKYFDAKSKPKFEKSKDTMLAKSVANSFVKKATKNFFKPTDYAPKPVEEEMKK